MNPVEKILGKKYKKKKAFLGPTSEEDAVEFGATYEEAYGNKVDKYGD